MRRYCVPAITVGLAVAAADFTRGCLDTPDIYPSAGALAGSLAMAVLACCIITVSAAVGLWWLLRPWWLSPMPRLAGRLFHAIPALLLAMGFVAWCGYRWQESGAELLSALQPLISIGVMFLVALAYLVLPDRVVRSAGSVLAVGLLVAGAAGVAGHSHFVSTDLSERPAGTPEIPRVILITVDTLRADALSHASPDAPPTPHIDRLAEESIRFRNAYASGGWTMPSVVSMLTGLPTFAHEMNSIHVEARALPDEIPTLAEHLREGGYATGAVVENPVLDPRFNLYQGFESYAHFGEPVRESEGPLGWRTLQALFPDRYAVAGGEDLNRVAEQWFDEHASEEFFFWIHYFDPHAPYTPSRRLLEGAAAKSDREPSFSMVEEVRGGMLVTAEEREWIRSLYDAEVRYSDEIVGGLLDGLRQRGLYDDSLIILTSDHGEEFWEHGGFEHGHSLYEEVIRVPLLVKLPRAARTGDVEHPVSLQNILPTVVSLTGVGSQSRCYQAPSMEPLWSSDNPEPLNESILSAGTVIFENREAVVFDGHKFILSTVSGREELFDLTRDPGEKQSLAGLSTNPARKGRDELSGQHEYFARVFRCYQPSEQPLRKASPAEVKRLKSLGYTR